MTDVAAPFAVCDTLWKQPPEISTSVLSSSPAAEKPTTISAEARDNVPSGASAAMLDGSATVELGAPSSTDRSNATISSAPGSVTPSQNAE